MDFNSLVAIQLLERPRTMDAEAEDRYYREHAGLSLQSICTATLRLLRLPTVWPREGPAERATACRAPEPAL